MDIVYTLSKNYNSEELRYSLRSLENLPHDRVFVVGGCPRWLKNVIHIPTEQAGTKYKNTTANIKIVCNDDRVSANFIYMNDDFFILEPIKSPTKELNLYNDKVSAVLDKLGKHNTAPTPYMRGMRETAELVKSLGIVEPLSYELHIPFIFNKKKFLKMLELDGINKINCLHKRSLYGNLYLKGGNTQRDVKTFLNEGFAPKKTGKFLSCDDGGFFGLHYFLFNKFPNKCKYEI